MFRLAVELPDLESLTFRSLRANVSKTRWATFFLCWSTLRGICRSIRNRHCGRPIANSNGVFNGWKNSCVPVDAVPHRPPRTNLKNYGNRRSNRKADRDRWGYDPEMRSSGRDAGMFCIAEGSVEFVGCGSEPLAPVLGTQLNRRAASGRT